MRLRSTGIRHCFSEGAGRESARTDRRWGRTRAGAPCELTCCKARLYRSPVSVLFSSCYGRQFGASPNGAGRTRFPLSSRGLGGRSPASGCAPAPVFLLYFTGKDRKHPCSRKASRNGKPSRMHGVSPALGADGNDRIARRINAPGSRIPRSAERRSFAVPSGSGQIVREYRKWVAARFRLSAFDGTPARCRCD
jgi:hypothetical protein